MRSRQPSLVRYLALAFAGEGPTDHEFASPLVARYTEQVVLLLGLALHLIALALLPVRYYYFLQLV